MLLSVDWDAFSGTRELVFDAPIWGTPDRPADRVDAWRARVEKRGGADWAALSDDFPLYGGWEGLGRYRGVPTWLCLSHADAWAWLERFPGREVLNVDSHHDLFSQSGDPARLRPGNWAGLGLQAGLISHYTCRYPVWHSQLPVAEGYDLERTWQEIIPHMASELCPRIRLERQDAWPPADRVEAILLVQSPAWTSPQHDPLLFKLATELSAETLTITLERSAV